MAVNKAQMNARQELASYLNTNHLIGSRVALQQFATDESGIINIVTLKMVMPLPKQGQGFIMYDDDLDMLLEKYGYMFPENYTAEDILNWCCRYVMANIEDVKEYFEDAN